MRTDPSDRAYDRRTPSWTAATTCLFAGLLGLGGCVDTRTCPSEGFARLRCLAYKSDRSVYLDYAKAAEAGEGGAPDCREAAVFYRAAARAESGGLHVWLPATPGRTGEVGVVGNGRSFAASGEAKYRLGQLYRRGCGVRRDKLKGDALIAEALAAGFVATDGKQ